ncbi:type I-B CRISPR-associated protein Cas5b [Thermotoga sp. KOL6]|uniref:type I-B CRISPR-associated protein Cas5b n=1 Tax=Thermotoga sp. KOL6 TaxID=126741 RepID=UPI000C76DE3C|nr:type I-B CRISPR-associated protein Cas5b [Thermotoga sp. KOL6]PLV58066.1 type I-B CRISPR-associated protein Cas5 [Thermotoga sp. KOL6]
MEVIVFDVSGPFGLFRRGYTTTSSYTLPFPPRPTVLGLVGCILGYRDIQRLQNANVAVQIKSPLKFLRMGTNFVETKDRGSRVRISLQLLKEPLYRIFFSWEDEDFYRLENLLRNGETIFTPYLGVASFIVRRIDFVGRFKAVPVEPPCEVHTVARGDTKLVPEPGQFLVYEKVTRQMNENRELIESVVYVFKKDLSPLKVEGGEVWKVADQNIVWM